MPTGRDDDEQRPRRRDDRPPRPDRSRSDRPRSDRARDEDRRGSGSGARRPGGVRDGRDRTAGGRPRRDNERPAGDRGPRPPIKGKRRTFDVDSAPNARERDRLASATTSDAVPAEGEKGPWRAERWVDEGPVRKAADGAVRRGARPAPVDRAAGTKKRDGRGPRDDASRGGAVRRKGKSAEAEVKADRNAARRKQRAAKRAEQNLELDRDRLTRQLGAAKAARVINRLGEASDAFAEDRYEDARRILKPLAEMVPAEPAIRELHGVALYRLGKWGKAVTELEEFTRLTQSTEQHPVLADCHRALGAHGRVEELWEELAAASPAAALVAEGRIVYSGSLADQGRLADAIAVLEDGSLGSKKLADHHLRMRYALGDLYDRAGEHQAARRYFESVAAADPSFFDVRDRLRSV